MNATDLLHQPAQLKGRNLVRLGRPRGAPDRPAPCHHLHRKVALRSPAADRSISTVVSGSQAIWAKAPALLPSICTGAPLINGIVANVPLRCARQSDCRRAAGSSRLWHPPRCRRAPLPHDHARLLAPVQCDAVSSCSGSGLCDWRCERSAWHDRDQASCWQRRTGSPTTFVA